MRFAARPHPRAQQRSAAAAGTRRSVADVKRPQQRRRGTAATQQARQRKAAKCRTKHEFVAEHDRAIEAALQTAPPPRSAAATNQRNGDQLFREPFDAQSQPSRPIDGTTKQSNCRMTVKSPAPAPRLQRPPSDTTADPEARFNRTRPAGRRRERIGTVHEAGDQRPYAHGEDLFFD